MIYNWFTLTIYEDVQPCRSLNHHDHPKHLEKNSFVKNEIYFELKLNINVLVHFKKISNLT